MKQNEKNRFTLIFLNLFDIKNSITSLFLFFFRIKIPSLSKIANMSKRRNFLGQTATVATGLPFLPFLEKYESKNSSDNNVNIYATNWGFKGSLDSFCKKAKDNGYNGIEVWTPHKLEAQKSLKEATSKYELKLGLLFGNSNNSFDSHYETFSSTLQNAIDLSPDFINCHSGRDYFSFDENSKIVEFTLEKQSQSGIPIYHETHRARIMFAAHVTKQFLEKYEELQLTLDISHWCCVHGSDLSDQNAAVQLALSRTGHIHSRVGFNQGPQIPNVDDPQYEKIIKSHFGWWDDVIDLHSKKGKTLTMTTEFGPPPYMWTKAYDGTPVADNWEVNVKMKKLWEERYSL